MDCIVVNESSLFHVIVQGKEFVTKYATVGFYWLSEAVIIVMRLFDYLRYSYQAGQVHHKTDACEIH